MGRLGLDVANGLLVGTDVVAAVLTTTPPPLDVGVPVGRRCKRLFDGSFVGFIDGRFPSEGALVGGCRIDGLFVGFIDGRFPSEGALVGGCRTDGLFVGFIDGRFPSEGALVGGCRTDGLFVGFIDGRFPSDGALVGGCRTDGLFVGAVAWIAELDPLRASLSLAPRRQTNAMTRSGRRSVQSHETSTDCDCSPARMDGSASGSDQLPGGSEGPPGLVGRERPLPWPVDHPPGTPTAKNRG